MNTKKIINISSTPASDRLQTQGVFDVDNKEDLKVLRSSIIFTHQNQVSFDCINQRVDSIIVIAIKSQATHALYRVPYFMAACLEDALLDCNIQPVFTFGKGNALIEML